MTYIKKIVMSGFKSFGDRTVSVKFGSGFTCIVGPNGNGKSNIVDAICFALGRLSKKTMRAKSLTDLIFAGTKTQKGATRADVEIHFDNKERVFPIDSDDYIISRYIHTDGKSGYKINGKNGTRQEILNALAQASIDPDGSNQFVLQGKIVELTHMNTTDRRQFIEALIGLEKYDDMKNQSLAELEKADQDLGQFEAIYKEVSTQLKKVEREKNDALRWTELDNAIKKYNAQLIALKISILRDEEEKIEVEIEDTKVQIDELNSTISKKKDEIEEINLYIKNLQAQLDTHNTEKEEIDKKITDARTNLSSKEAELKAAKNSIDRLNERKAKLEQQQTKLEEGETYDILISRTKDALDLLQAQIDETNEAIAETVAEQKARESKIDDHNKKKSGIVSEISKIRETISKLDAEVNLLNKNIKKNSEKKTKEEAELRKLKKEDESIDDAIKKVQEQSDRIEKTIEELRTSIGKLNQEQKDIDKDIVKAEKERDKINNKATDAKSQISSKQAEITMTENRIEALKKKIKDLTDEYQRLSQGKSIEEAIRALRDKEKEKLGQIKASRDKLANLQGGQKKKEMEKESIELKRTSVQNEINDFSNRIAALKVELANNKKELKNSERDRMSLDLLNQGLLKDIKSLEDSIEKIKKKQDSCIKRIDEKNKEKELKQVEIKRRESEYETSKNEVESVLKILEMMLERIHFSIGEIKSTMQNAGEDVINDTVDNFKSYVDDINNIFQIISGTVDERQSLNDAEFDENMKAIIKQFEMMDENSRLVIDNFMTGVRNSQDTGLKKSMEPIDFFVNDLSELFDNARIVFSKLALSQSSEIYMQLDQINNEIAVITKENSENQTEIALLTSKIEQKKNESSSTSNKLKDLDAKLKDLTAKVEKGDEEFKTKNDAIAANTKKIDEINDELKKLKDFSDSYWKEQQSIQAEIDGFNNDLTKIQADLNELNTINRILKERDEAEEEVESSKKMIEEKKSSIAEIEKKIGAINDEITAVNENINKLKAEKENKFSEAQQLQVNIDKENEQLKEVTDIMRGLETVQKLIKSIENLGAEIAEAEERIEVNKEQIESSNQEIEEKNKLIAVEDESIAVLTKERKELETVEAGHRDVIVKLNKDVQATTKVLSDQEQMLKREHEIKEIIAETEATENSIVHLDEMIKSIDETIAALDDERIGVVEQINKLNQELQEGYSRQNKMRDEYGELNAQHSKLSTIFNQLESRKTMINDKIQDLFDMGKEYGTLPEVTPDLSESGLSQSIDKADKEKKALEPVNLKAIEYYDEIKERFDEIDTRRQTLQRERKAIMDSIERLELEKRKQFMKAFHEINRVFSEVFEKLSPGGSARMLLENPSDPFAAGIEIEARPRGKKISSLDILSGGEKTLVALSFIFAVQTFYPAPFYIMDEIDAALDGPNVFAVSNVIKEYAKRAQFIVISHREENISNADRIYGVAMQNQITDIFMHDLTTQVESDADQVASGQN